jgi:putative drug exporter of the RND superfamily
VMQHLGFTGRMALFAARHPWRVIGIWIVALTGAVLLAGNMGGVLTNEAELAVSIESQRAQDLIDIHFPDSGEGAQEFIILEADEITSEAAGFTAKMEALTADLRQARFVTSVVSYLDGAPGMLSEDGTTALIQVTLEPDGDVVDQVVPMLGVTKAAETDGFRITSLGNGSAQGEFNQLSEETLRRGELLGVPIAMVILLLVFGTAVAAGMPLVLGVVAIVVALGLTTVVGQWFELSFFVTNMITMIGLAVGIDYSLFVVQRFREERAKGNPVTLAVARAGNTATRAVFFSGLTVVIALTGLLFMPDSIMRSLGMGAMLAVVGAVAGALTLLPAMLGVLGDRVNKLRIPLVGRREYGHGGGRFWRRITQIVMARPLLSLTAAVVVLLAAAAPYLTISTGQNFIEGLPDDSDVVHAFEVLNREFDTGAITTPIVVDADPSRADIQLAVGRLTESLQSDPVYGQVGVTPSPDGEIVVLEPVTKLDPSTEEARAAVQALRAVTIPAAFAGVEAEVLVTGQAAYTTDYVGVLDSRTPLIFVFVLGVSFLLLMTVFRSIIVPLKAIVMNLLSVGAAYGLLVLVFKHGFGADLFGFEQTDVIEAWIPMFLFTVLFGLSMDYHIFLLSRIKEHWDLTGDNDESVPFGMVSTGAIITGAALIMVAVFGGFAAGPLVMFQQMGFGLAVAVILDATIVRSVLVPSAMKLLGDRNWYLPRWLRWLPEIHIEATPEGATEPAVPREPASL